MSDFLGIKAGDKVLRQLGPGPPFMRLLVTAVDENFIYCGDWKFSRRNGAEIDEFLGWDERKSGSQLVAKEAT